jgi:hypothetical protein
MIKVAAPNIAPARVIDWAIQAFGERTLPTISDCPAVLRLPVPADRR